MKTLVISSIAMLLYLLFGWLTYRVCRSGTTSLDEFDRILMPTVAVLWPLAWGFVVVNEIIGFFNRVIKNYRRKQRIKKKAKQHAKRLKMMNS